MNKVATDKAYSHTVCSDCNKIITIGASLRTFDANGEYIVVCDDCSSSDIHYDIWCPICNDYTTPDDDGLCLDCEGEDDYGDEEEE